MTTATASPAIREISTGVWKAQSKSHPNAAHTVRRGAEGFSCTCPATRKCWHIKEIEAMSKPEPTFIPVSDPVDDDPFAGMDEPIIGGMKPVTTPAGLSTSCKPVPPIPHKPSMAELVDFFCN